MPQQDPLVKDDEVANILKKIEEYRIAAVSHKDDSALMLSEILALREERIKLQDEIISNITKSLETQSETVKIQSEVISHYEDMISMLKECPPIRPSESEEPSLTPEEEESRRRGFLTILFLTAVILFLIWLKSGAANIH